MSMFRTARQNRVYQDIVEQIQDAILNGQLKVGDMLPPERELKEVFQTSRGTLREALRVLEERGLIEIKLGTGGGAVVKAVSSDRVAESLDLLGDNLREVRPTKFVGVPRVWEKIQAKMVAAGAQNSGLKKKIAAWARQKGLANGYARQEGKPAPAFFSLAHKLVFSKVHERLGLDRCRLFISTAAPISLDTLEFFMSLDIPITEVYGMSECTGPGTVSLPEPFQYRTGWAGPALPGTEIAVSEHGEVLMRGRHVFKGYFKNEEATKDTIDEEG